MSVLKRVLKSKKGLSLVEVLVSIGILAVVSGMIAGFVITASNTYGRINADISMQYEAQLAMSYIQDKVIDTNAGICFTSPEGGSPELSLLRRVGTGWEVESFRFDEDENALYYRIRSVISDPNGYPLLQDSEETLLANDVESFDAPMEKLENRSRTGYKVTVTIQIGFEKQSKTYLSAQVVTIRNPIAVGDTLQGLLNNVCRASETTATGA